MPYKKKPDAKPKEPKVKAPPKPFEAHIVTDEELVPDGELLCKFTIPGRPATKKTHQQVVWIKGSPRVLPSAQFTTYEKSCKISCEAAWKGDGMLPMDFGIAIKVYVYLNTWSVGDHVGYLQAIGDIIEKYGIIANDKWIHWLGDNTHWFGGVDKDNPRTEIEIYRFRHPYEEYRSAKEKKLIKNK